MSTHGLQHSRLPCPSLSPRVCSNSCSLSLWCYLTISSSAASLSICHQSCPASGSLSMNQLFASDGQSIGDSSSASVVPINIQADFFGIDWFDLFIVPFIMCFIVLLNYRLLVWWQIAVVREDHVQCSGENSKSILLSFYDVLYFHFYLHYPSVYPHCLLYPVESLTC